MERTHCKTFYEEMIIQALGCSEEDAPKVEEWMRLTYRTLNGLSKEQFHKAATDAYEMVNVMKQPGIEQYLETLYVEFTGRPSNQN